jgi:Xaa-Pro dipeptidase
MSGDGTHVSRGAATGYPGAKIRGHYVAVEERVLRAYDIIKPRRRSPISIKEIVAAVQCKGVPHFEAPYYDPGFAGLQVEGMVRVTRDSAGSLMSLSMGLRIL